MENNDVKYYVFMTQDFVYTVFKIIKVDKDTLHCLKACRYFDSYNIDISLQSVSDFTGIYQDLYLKDASPITKEVFDSLFADFKEQIEGVI